MNGYACSEQDVLLDTYGPEIAGIGHLSASAGTFALRRARYFNESGYFNETGRIRPKYIDISAYIKFSLISVKRNRAVSSSFKLQVQKVQRGVA